MKVELKLSFNTQNAEEMELKNEIEEAEDYIKHIIGLYSIADKELRQAIEEINYNKIVVYANNNCDYIYIFETNSENNSIASLAAELINLRR